MSDIAEIFDDCSWRYSFDDATAKFLKKEDKHDNVFMYSNFWQLNRINHLVFKIDNIIMFSDKLTKLTPAQILNYFFTQLSGEKLDIHKHTIETIGPHIVKITWSLTVINR